MGTEYLCTNRLIDDYHQISGDRKDYDKLFIKC